LYDDDDVGAGVGGCMVEREHLVAERVTPRVGENGEQWRQSWDLQDGYDEEEEEGSEQDSK
jgi:hypothetical protein